MNDRCATEGCVNPPALFSLHCLWHKSGRKPNGYGPGEGNFELDEPVEYKAPPIECRSCPLCELLTVIPMHWYYWAERDVCDVWVCFACGLRVYPNKVDERGDMIVHLPTVRDLQFNDNEEGWWL